LTRVSTIFLVIAIFASFSIPTLSQPEIPEFLKWRNNQVGKSSATKKTTDTEQRGTENSPLVVKVKPSKSAQEQSEEDRRESDKLWYDRITAWSTLSAALITLAALAVAIFQAVFFRQQLGLMKDALGDTEMAAKAAQDSAKAAIRQGENFAAVERAFVYCDTIEAFPMKILDTDTIGEWHCNAIWKNTGRTNTKSAVYSVFVYTSPLPLPEDFNYPQDRAPESIVFGPGGSLQSLTILLKVDLLRQVRNQEHYIYVMGWTEYRDIFSPELHRSEFCLRLFVIGEPDRPDCKLRFRKYGPFNGFDEECFRKAGEAAPIEYQPTNS